MQATIDFSLASNNDDIRDHFEENFPVWARAIVTYCKETQVKSSSLQAETSAYSDDMDEGTV